MKQNKGFTLIELLVVIAVIVALTVILVPVFTPQMKESAREINCLSNMKQLGTGLAMYVQDYDETYPNYRFLPLGSQNRGDFEQNSWKSMLEPYTKNKQIFVCPNNPSRKTASDDPEYKISYAANTALNPRDYPAHSSTPPIPRTAKGSGIFGNERSPGVKTSDVVSPAKCIALVEMAHLTQNNFCVDIADDGAPRKGENGQTVRAYSDALFTGHKGGSNYVFADTHAKWLKPTQTNSTANFWYRDGTKLSFEGNLTLQNAEANKP